MTFLPSTHQQLGGATDEELIEKCCREGRGLVSLDLDFANPLRFQPSKYPGIAVLRLPSKPSADDLTNLIRTLARALTGDSIAGRLWMVERGRVRIYQESDLK
jgi:predicted nuclease of predicted toxin-antitoxin system